MPNATPTLSLRIHYPGLMTFRATLRQTDCTSSTTLFGERRVHRRPEAVGRRLWETPGNPIHRQQFFNLNAKLHVAGTGLIQYRLLLGRVGIFHGSVKDRDLDRMSRRHGWPSFARRPKSYAPSVP